MKENGLPKQSDDARFAASVKRFRERLGWSQGELAKRMSEAGFDGFHQTTVSRIEKNDRPVRIGEAIGLAKILGSQVSLMIAPDEHWDVLDGLMEELDDLGDAHDALTSAISEYVDHWYSLKQAQLKLGTLGNLDLLDGEFRRLAIRVRNMMETMLDRSFVDEAIGMLDPIGKPHAEADDAQG